MNRNALVIHENKCTSSIFIFTLRFSVDFLWISRFCLCLGQERSLASLSRLGTAQTLWFTGDDLEGISGGFFPPWHSGGSVLTGSLTHILGLNCSVHSAEAARTSQVGFSGSS